MRALISTSAAMALAAFMSLTTGPTVADEGMWTFDHLPLGRLASDHDFTPAPGWADHLRNSTVRLAQGCSGSFISSNGLLLTNHHCARECLQGLSTPDVSLVDLGFLAPTGADEKRCPDLEVDQLVEITHVTDRIISATAGRTGADGREAEQAAIEAIEHGCDTGEAVRCDVVTLFHGAVYDLYKYRRFQDVRLVFAPEGDVAAFGDTSTADWPMHALDMSLVRVYDHGRPLDTRTNHLSPASKPAAAGELVFVVGNPGQTERLSTVAQLQLERDLREPMIIADYAELYGMSAETARDLPDLAQPAGNEMFESQLLVGRFILEHRALSNRGLYGSKVQAEADLRAKVAADPALAARYGGAWDAISQAMLREREFYERFTVLESRPRKATLMYYATLLVRDASERSKPDSARLDGFRDGGQPALRAQILSPAAVNPAWERRMLTWVLSRLPLYLGTSDPATIQLLGHESPIDLAARLVGGTRLGDVKVRRALLDGGPAAIAASNDPLIVYVRDQWEPLARAVLEQDEAVQSTLRVNAALIDQARLAVLGPNADPDATFSPRVSYGVVRGYQLGGASMPAMTTFGEAYNEDTGRAPYRLPPSWLTARRSLDPATTLNLASTADVVGGSSGSPMVNREGNLVGLVFAQNDAAEAGTFGHDEAEMRAIAVSMPAIRLALTKIYHADRLMREIDGETARAPADAGRSRR